VGLFSSISRAIGGITERVGGLFTTVTGAVGGLAGALTPLVQAAAPIASQFISARFGGLGGLGGQRGAGAVTASAFAPQRPPIGVLGAQSRFANPIARAQLFPPFDPSRLPARPAFGFSQLQRAFNPPPRFPQTTAFNQGAFGGTVGPSFRPFAPSFRSGQFGFSGQFQPGFQAGLPGQFPQQQFGFPGFQQQQFPQPFQQQQFRQPFQQQQFLPQPRVQQFGGFGGFGGFSRFGGFGGF